MTSTGTDTDDDGQCDAGVDYVTLRDYPWDTVVLSLSQTHGGKLEPPVAVVLK